MDINELKEKLKAQKNRCQIGIILCDLGRPDLLPTCLEDMEEYQDEITWPNCVEDK